MPKILAIFLAIRTSRLRDPRVELGRQVVTTGLLAATLVAGHIIAMVVFEDLGVDPAAPLLERTGMATWLTLTTMTTVGYGDVTATTPMGRTATVVLMYFGAVYTAARLVGLVIEYRFDRRSRRARGTWRWDMRDHVVILNAPGMAAETHLGRLLVQLRADPDFAELPVLLLSPNFPEGLPDRLRDLGLVHYTGSPNDSSDLAAVDVRHAADVIVLAQDETDTASDTMNFDVLHRVRELHAGGQIVVEVVDDANRKRFLDAGAMVTLRPMRAYPEMLVRAMTAPGAELVLEDLLTPGGSVVRRYNLRLRGNPWQDIVGILMNAGHGTALAYVDEHAEVVPNPGPQDPVHGYGLIVAARPDRVPTRAQVLELLAELPAPALARR